MAEFNVTISELVAKANELNELNGQFKTQVGSLTDTEATLNSMWEGQARETFHNAFVSDVNQMGAFYNAVNQYVQTLLATAQKYQQAEAQNVEIGNTRTYH